MDIFEKAIEQWEALESVKAWPELAENFSRLARKKPHGWDLPCIGGKAVGGTEAEIIVAVAAVGSIQMGIILIDDILDNDPLGHYHKIGVGSAANLASAFLSGGLTVIAKSGVFSETGFNAQIRLTKMIMQTARGQHLDVQNRMDEEGYWEVVRTKSSPFYGAALSVGSVLSGASPDAADQIYSLGALYGEIIQIHDDLKDTMESPANSDWLEGRYPLPILFATIVDHPDRERFIEIRKKVSDTSVLREAQEILMRCGAVSYSLEQLLKRFELAKSQLAQIEILAPQYLVDLLDDVVIPLRELIELVGAEMPPSLNKINA